MKTLKVSFAACLICVFVQACTDRGIEAPYQSTVSGSLGKVALSFDDPPGGITEVVATISRPSFPSRVLQLAILDTTQSASGSFADVEPGVWHLRVEAKDSSHVVRYSGETDVQVVAGQITNVTLQLVAGTGGGIHVIVTWGVVSNLLVNGSFEQGPAVGPYLPVDSGSTTINGWVVSRGQIDIVRYWRNYNGDRGIDLNGSPGRGGIRQTFATTSGATYRVTFAMAGNPEGVSTPIMRMGVSAAGSSTEFSFDITGKSITNMGWQIKSWTFVALGSLTSLEFYSLMAPSWYGPVIDYVSVERVL